MKPKLKDILNVYMVGDRKLSVSDDKEMKQILLDKVCYIYGAPRKAGGSLSQGALFESPKFLKL